MAALLRRLELMFAWEEIRCRQRNVFGACEVEKPDVVLERDNAARAIRAGGPPLANRDLMLEAQRMTNLARSAKACYDAVSGLKLVHNAPLA
jgi:hypothetical protein